MFEISLYDKIIVTVEPGSHVCIEDSDANTSVFYEWDEYLKIDPAGEEESCRALKTLESVLDTFARKLTHQCQSSS